MALSPTVIRLQIYMLKPSGDYNILLYHNLDEEALGSFNVRVLQF